MFFEFFLLLFSKFSCRGRVWTEFGTKIFFSLSRPISFRTAKNNIGNKIFNFLNFFAIFFGIFLLGSSRNGILDKNFFLSFSAYLIPFRLKIMLERSFLIFWIFLLFFSDFLARVEYERISGLKFFSLFHGLSHPVLAKNNTGKRFFNFINFLLFFSKFSCPCRVWTELGTKIFFSLSRPMSSPFGWK